MTHLTDREKYPQLSSMLQQSFQPYWSEEFWLDFDEAVMAGLVGTVGWHGDPSVVGRQMAAFLAEHHAASDDALNEALVALGATEGFMLPEGAPIRKWAERLIDIAQDVSRCHRITADTEARSRLPLLPRGSMFSDPDSGSTAIEQVLSRHERQLEWWATGTTGLWRTHIYEDLGYPTGLVQYVKGGDTPAVTALVLILRLDHETGEPEPVSAYPEVTVDPTARSRYADLPALFGGYFGQEWLTLERESIWVSTCNFMASTSPEAKARIVEQLDALLQDTLGQSDEAPSAGDLSGGTGTTDDSALRVALHNLGCYVFTGEIRDWVTRLRDYSASTLFEVE